MKNLCSVWRQKIRAEAKDFAGTWGWEWGSGRESRGKMGPEVRANLPETALVKVTNNFRLAKSYHQFSVLPSLDLSANWPDWSLLSLEMLPSVASRTNSPRWFLPHWTDGSFFGLISSLLGSHLLPDFQPLDVSRALLLFSINVYFLSDVNQSHRFK